MKLQKSSKSIFERIHLLPTFKMPCCARRLTPGYTNT